ncbi:hypothetical protein ABT369_31650 [Dactylosporangium sp. NPDC000244]|uniref:hypothetical protein n=1 Tax=Dactylosporangium sp. NPDC000244 TaxID=3154365 RepID=UPI00332BCD1C
MRGGARFTAGADSFGADPRSVTVLGVAPGGRFELVRLQFSSIGLGADIVRVRSREGLRSREAGQDLACFVVPFDHDAAPERTFASARFVGGTTVEVTTADGTAWNTAFGQHTLLAAPLVLPRLTYRIQHAPSRASTPCRSSASSQHVTSPTNGVSAARSGSSRTRIGSFLDVSLTIRSRRNPKSDELQIFREGKTRLVAFCFDLRHTYWRTGRRVSLTTTRQTHKPQTA